MSKGRKNKSGKRAIQSRKPEQDPRIERRRRNTTGRERETRPPIQVTTGGNYHAGWSTTRGGGGRTDSDGREPGTLHAGKRAKKSQARTDTLVESVDWLCCWQQTAYQRVHAETTNKKRLSVHAVFAENGATEEEDF